MNRDFQQTLEPRLYYLNVEFDEQADLPQFDATPATPSYAQLFRNNRFPGYDRLGDANQVSLGISSSLLFSSTGAEFLRASIGQTYFFQDREVIFRPSPAYDPTAETSPIFLELRMALGSTMSLNTIYEWDPHEERTNRGKLSFKYYPDARRIVNVTYSYTSPEVVPLGVAGLKRNSEETDLSFFWPVYRNWSALGRWNYGWDSGQTVESLFGVEYNGCCWRFRVAYHRFLKEPRLISVSVDDPGSPTGETTFRKLDHRSDSGIFFEFQLKGLADLGGRLDSLLEDSIPGYRAREDRIDSQ
jgi:LPS-assembly protein